METYKSAAIYLLGSFENDGNYDTPKARRNDVWFTRANMLIVATMPTGIWDKPKIKQEYASQISEMVSSDLETIDDLILAISEHAKIKKKSQGNFRYCIEDGYNVYELSDLPVFKVLQDVNNTNPRLLNPEFNGLVKPASYVANVNGDMVVKGKTLKQAMEKTLEIYGHVEKIEEAMIK